MMHLPLYIAAGGRSSRFGSDKARADVNGIPLILHVARRLEEAVSSLTVVADVEHKFEDLQLRTIADQHPGFGPMAALHAALDDQKHEGWLLLVSCDFV